MKRFLSVLVFFIFIFCVIPPTTHAQRIISNCVITEVGNAEGGEPNYPPECEQGAPGEGPKPPNYPANLRTAIINEFNITMNGFNNDELKWAWERFWSTSNTKFNALNKGAIITKTGGRYSRQVGCPPNQTVQLHGGYAEAYFKFIITHELGHAIRNCHDRRTIRYNDHLNAFANEGAISYYGGHASSCTGSDNHSEDYADTIAYYMTPSAGLSSGPCGPGNPPNPYFELKPRKELHYTNVAVPVLR